MFNDDNDNDDDQVIAAEGEKKASQALREAADTISQSPAALQLRYLQVVLAFDWSMLVSDWSFCPHTVLSLAVNSTHSLSIV